VTCFYLGTHHPHWLGRVDVPLFVSRRSLAKRRSLPRASAPWALDSGGFTELQLHGRWTLTPAEYAAEVRRYRDEIGMLAFAAPQDWMCEPAIIGGGTVGRQRFAGTGLSVAEHQRRTIENYLELCSLAPELPWIPVVQGYSLGDYWHHADDYARAGVELDRVPLVGIGSVCRRQGMGSVGGAIAGLASSGVRIHAFGFKLRGLETTARFIASADSLAWSQNALRNPPLPGHTHKTCANCVEYALEWRQGALRAIERGMQLDAS